jgi:hypothetical protein
MTDEPVGGNGLGNDFHRCTNFGPRIHHAGVVIVLADVATT